MTTSAATPEITQPTILSPVSGSADLVPDISLVSSTYTPLNGAGAHTSSDWQVYEADKGVLSTSVITANTVTSNWNQAVVWSNGVTKIGRAHV